MSNAWVVGSGGLLGSALARALAAQGRTVFQPADKLRWSQAETLGAQMQQAVAQFAGQLEPGRGWLVCWAAGIGTMGSDAAALQAETLALGALLDALASHPALAAEAGALAFASSAGAIYAGCADELITEGSAAAPTTAYGEEKLRQEALLREFAQRMPQHKLLLARISTVFGPRRPGRPAQGLFSFLARSMFRGEPVRIFVPLDTMRDYIYADDAAQAMLRALDVVRPAQGPLVKIVASQRTTTIAEIVSVFARVGHRHPRIVTGATPLSAKYGGRVQYRSLVGGSGTEPPPSPLHVCVARMLESERLAYVSPAPH